MIFSVIEFDLNKADCESHGCKWDAYGKHVKCYIDPQSYGYEVSYLQFVKCVTNAVEGIEINGKVWVY